MKLDSEAQRQMLLKCLANTQISGVVEDLFPLLTDIANLIETVKTAPIEDKPKLSQI